MGHATMSRRPRSITTAAALAALLAIAPGSAFAQDASQAPDTEPASPAAESPAPAAETAPASGEGPALSTDELAALIPAEVAGVPVERSSITVLVGEEMAQGNESTRAQYEAVEAATGVPVDAMAQVTALVPVDDEGTLLLGVLRVPGADARTVLEAVLPVALEQDEGLTSEEGEIGGVAVTLLDSPSIADGSVYAVYPLGSLLWLALGDEAAVAAALAGIAD